MKTAIRWQWVILTAMAMCATAFAEGRTGSNPLSVGEGLLGIGAGLGLGFLVFGAGFGISRIASAACESIARQPEAAGDIRGAMILTAALIEGVALFGAVICLLIQGQIPK
ncbi:MAG: ATP synthase F0 subunit C [Planctomycetes bacterium]|nr:ATP synthase F0 subunit C [Planctomycetota bacterium]MBI3844741.1 ATP synthase F0 subunit C [Planctomycetota bacterium]